MPDPSPPPPRMRLRFCGVRGSIPTPEEGFLGVGGNTSCVEVRARGAPICILDAGTGARRLGIELSEAGEAEDLHLFLSHFHWDHLQGLPFFAPLYGAGHRVTFYAGEPVERLEELLIGQMSAPYFPVPFRTLAADCPMVEIGPEAPVTLGSLTLRPFPLNHTQPTLGFRLEAHGAVAVYASDYEHGHPHLDEVLREMAAGADVLISDAQYTPEEYVPCRGWGHTTWLEATRVARDAEVKQLVLFHHDPLHNDEALAHILEEARRHFPNTVLATEQTVIEL